MRISENVSRVKVIVFIIQSRSDSHCCIVLVRSNAPWVGVLKEVNPRRKRSRWLPMNSSPLSGCCMSMGLCLPLSES